MERVTAANGAVVDHGLGAIHWEILWQEMRILGYVMFKYFGMRQQLTGTGWAKYMEWNYPVEIVVTNKAAFRAAGAVEAAASL
jgi:hypothetical protein